jgi:hypothetical protein
MILNEFDVVVAPESETVIIQHIKDAAGPSRFPQGPFPGRTEKICENVCQ